LIIDINCKAPAELLADEELTKLFEYSEILLQQNKDSKKKLYSIHEPDVECIGKGKAHKKYEFGNKVGLLQLRGNVLF